jgi:cytochrome P450
MNEEAGLFLKAQNDETVSEKDLERSDRPRTLFQCIIASNIPQSEKTQDRLAQEAFVVVVAGSETTSRVLSAAIFHLHANLPILERLRKEIDAAMPNADIIPTSKTLSKNTYLNIVIKETLRISAPITSRTPLVPRTALPYTSHLIPAHTPTSLTIHDVLLDARAFPDPDCFMPERWLQTPGPPEKFFVPFGNGTRMCQGLRVAYAELYLALTVLIRRFEFRLYDTVRERDVDAVRDCFVGETHPASQGIRVEIVAMRD